MEEIIVYKMNVPADIRF